MSPRSALVVSPHADDAAFSLSTSLAVMGARGVHVTIATVFSVSEFAFNGTFASAEEVRRARVAEDDAFVRRLPGCVRRVDLGRLDAPLRGARRAGTVRRTGPLRDDELVEAAPLAEQLGGLGRFDLVFAPLALGGHTDHRIARHAVHLIWPLAVVAYYEDLPYAADYRTADILTHVRELESTPRQPLVPLLQGGPGSLPEKVAYARIYASQLRARDLERIVSHTRRMGGREQIWAPGGPKSAQSHGWGPPSGSSEALLDWFIRGPDTHQQFR